MANLARYIVALVVFAHGLIHLMGFVAYWPLAELSELPYKTALVGGRYEVGAGGMRVFSVAWLVVGAGFVLGALALALRQDWWLPVAASSAVLSLILTGLDWEVAFRGALLNLVILVPILGAVGLRVEPQPLPPVPFESTSLGSFALDHDLPAPVERYYRTTIGKDIPLVESAIITGHGKLRFMGITFPARIRFTHDAGQGYRHYLEATLFGYPVLKVDEWYLNGHARLRLPFGVVEGEPKVDSGANLGLWGESFWLPSIFLTHPRVRWESVNETTASLVVPSKSGTESFTVQFDSETGLLESVEALRYKGADSETKTPWRFDVLGWESFGGLMLPSPGTVTWEDEGTPWLTIVLEQVVYNADVSEYIHSNGP